MPFPSAMDLSLFDLLSHSPDDIRRRTYSNASIPQAYGDEHPIEQGAYPEPRTVMELSGIWLRIYELGRQNPSSSGAFHQTVTHPVFDELWELKGREGTRDDMAKLLAGGESAEQFRQEVVQDRADGNKNTAEKHELKEEMQAVLSRLERMESLLEQITQQGQHTPPVPSFSDSVSDSDYTDLGR